MSAPRSARTVAEVIDQLIDDIAPGVQSGLPAIRNVLNEFVRRIGLDLASEVQ